LPGGGSPLLVLAPEHAHTLARGGLSRAAAQVALWERATLPLDRLPVRRRERIARGLGTREAPTTGPLRVAAAPDDILIAVAGGVGAKSTYLPSWGGGTRAVTVAVE
jgi:hypothetical protein